MRSSPSLDSVIFAAIGTAILALVGWTVFHRRQLGHPAAYCRRSGADWPSTMGRWLRED